ncbi:uncharacterized protein LOC116288153 isoform X1 [Actinia tenebrosa]|uniref:Uncharacterized protein LOC116288153 isoform X1 n=1 Tax=Actinia tenebrosa TaxID=6105 RepID=A0A6P8H5L7_ACTTE|nr:uncharacterized protein LOC116288153 isoform X1 [Actinia tenebrosa]
MVCAFSYPAILILLLQNGYITGLTSWPDGKYGLLKPTTGCPEEWTDKEWKKTRVKYKYGNNRWSYRLEYRGLTDRGFIFQTTDDNYPNIEASQTLNMEEYVDPDFVLRYFCVKRTEVKPSSIKWPPGQYCIYERGKQPGGRIRMYDMDYSYRHSTKYVKDFTDNWYHSINLHFSCQTSGNEKIPISLPITKPFYLLPYGSRDCQQVEWMVATTEWIKYHTGNYKDRSYQKSGTAVPFYEIGDIKNKGITMYYCYYESCNYTLTNTTGVFQSPGFPGEYPDGQLCSWRIMVPDNHTLHVHFTNFSLYEYDKDCLQLYENNSRIFKHRQAFFGQQPPFTITATSDVMFVFRSDEENNSTGFRANYTMFKTPERTTTAPPKPPTTTTLPTTTTQSTTKLITTQPTTTKQPTTKRPSTTEATTTFPTTPNINSTANETVQCIPITTKNKSYNKDNIHSLKKTCFCDETWRIVIMVLPLVVFILIVLVIIDIFCRCRSIKALQKGTSGSSVDDGMVVNPTYEQGNIIIDQSTGATTDVSTVNTVDEQPQSRDEPPDYEDVDYTQLNEVPHPRRSTKRQECHALEPIGYDTPDVFYHVLEPPNIESSDGPQCYATNHSGKEASSVFYHVLEPPEIESDGPQFHAPEPVGNGAPEVSYHTLESPTALNRPTYQNLSEVNHYTLNPLYESAENSAPLVEANKLYDNSIA